MTHHLVGMAEVAELLGLSRQRAHELTRRPDFPAPQARLKAGAGWLREEVERWLTESGANDAPAAHANATPERPDEPTSFAASSSQDLRER